MYWKCTPKAAVTSVNLVWGISAAEGLADCWAGLDAVRRTSRARPYPKRMQAAFYIFSSSVVALDFQVGRLISYGQNSFTEKCESIVTRPIRSAPGHRAAA